MEALHDVVKAGKARYLGGSAMHAWQFAKMQHVADAHGWTRFVSMQDQYSLMYREEEREMFGLLADQGVGSIPYSPLAKGRLARPFGEHTKRSDNDPVGRAHFGDGDEADHRRGAARRRGPRHPDGAGRARLGAAQPGRLGADRRRDEVAPPRRRRRGTRGELTDDEVATLESAYVPRMPVGY